jgi:hypothetical protein
MLKKQHQVAIAALFVLLAIIPAYKVKSRMGVNILPGPHTPNLMEKLTRGKFKAEWVDRNWFRRPDLLDLPFNS